MNETNCVCPNGLELINGPKCVKPESVLVLSGYADGPAEEQWQPAVVITLKDSLLGGDPKKVECFHSSWSATLSTEKTCVVRGRTKNFLQ